MPGELQNACCLTSIYEVGESLDGGLCNSGMAHTSGLACSPPAVYSPDTVLGSWPSRADSHTLDPGVVPLLFAFNVDVNNVVGPWDALPSSGCASLHEFPTVPEL